MNKKLKPGDKVIVVDRNIYCYYKKTNTTLKYKLPLITTVTENLSEFWDYMVKVQHGSCGIRKNQIIPLTNMSKLLYG